jgi:MerR family transcriptional regulator, repressor of the yfmOP operon
MAEPKAPRASNEPYLQIGEVADRTGVTQRTLRFYEERGLLKPPSRMEGGFRLYSQEDILRVEQIKRLQNLLGLTLAEIKDMVEGEEVRSEMRATYRPDLQPEERLRRVTHLRTVTERQRAIIDHKIEALREMQRDFEEKINRYDAVEKEMREQLQSQAEGAVSPAT